MKKDWLGLAVAVAILLAIMGAFFLFLRFMLPKRRGKDFYLPRVGADFYPPRVKKDFYVPKVDRRFYVPKPPKR